MIIEKINENQIRCTLTQADLEEHQINLSELAYGSDSAKKLFQEMMNQAMIEYGFQADNIPLMIEAIPVSNESIVLIITKVEDPEELDMRFSKFAPFKRSGSTSSVKLDGADEILDMFQKFRDSISGNRRSLPEKDSQDRTASIASANNGINLIRLYHFDTMDEVIAASHGLKGFFEGENTLYKGSFDSGYELIIHQSTYSPEDFNKICNILSEYGSGKNVTESTEAYLIEHGQMLTGNAVQQLQEL